MSDTVGRRPTGGVTIEAHPEVDDRKNCNPAALVRPVFLSKYPTNARTTQDMCGVAGGRPKPCGGLRRNGTKPRRCAAIAARGRSSMESCTPFPPFWQHCRVPGSEPPLCGLTSALRSFPLLNVGRDGPGSLYPASASTMGPGALIGSMDVAVGMAAHLTTRSILFGAGNRSSWGPFSIGGP